MPVSDPFSRRYGAYKQAFQLFGRIAERAQATSPSRNPLLGQVWVHELELAKRSHDLLCLVGPHSHPRVSGASEEIGITVFEDQDVARQEWTACLHQSCGQSGIASLVRR
jgi:hypothetical protein